MKKNAFAKGEAFRANLTNAQRKQIQNIYKEIAQNAQKRIKILSTKENISSVLRADYLQDMIYDIKKEISKGSKKVETIVNTNVEAVSKAVVKDNDKLLKTIGIDIKGAYSYVPSEVVNTIASGKLYKDKWSLSSAIWGNDKKILSDIDMIVAKGVAENKSSYDIAKDLEAFVNPNKAKKWDWSKVYPGTAKKIDYNAQRLARTMVSHAYQETFVRTTILNPFISAYQWHSGHTERTCELCIERDGQIYEKDELPLDHPNGICYFTIEQAMTDKQMADRLVDWVNGTDDKQLDKFASSLIEKDYNIKFANAVKKEVKEKVVKTANKINNNFNIKREANYLDKLNAQNQFHLSSDSSNFKLIAKEWKVSKDKANEIIKNKIFSLIEKNDIGTRKFTGDLKSILKDGSIKNQFQTGSSNGVIDCSLRKKVEDRVMSVPVDTSDKERPIYGMLFDTTSDKEKIKSYFSYGPGDWYGDANVIFKKDAIKENMTFTFGDSLSNYYEKISESISFTHDTKYIGYINDSLTERIKDMSIDKFENASVSDIFRNNYLEVQVHGIESKKINCIEKVIFTKKPDDEMIELLKQKEIPYELL